MTALARPDLRLHESWTETVLDFGSEQIHGSGFWELPEEQRHGVTRSDCERTVETLLRCADPRVVLPDERVHCDYFWITDAARDVGTADDVSAAVEVVGFIALRHELNAFLLEEGGHIGYSVRPARRGRGHASRALELCVHQAATRGLDSVLVTCGSDNTASRRTIERAGGRYEDTRRGKRRYWISTATRSRDGGLRAPR